jgi:hypothetical protein
MNQCSLRHSSRSRPLKLSMYAFCTGFAGVDEMQVDPMGIRAGVQGLPGEFGAVIHRDQLRQTTLSDQAVQDPRHPQTRQRGIHLRCKALSGEIINHGQNPDPPATGQSVSDEVHGPPLVLAFRCGPGGSARRLPSACACVSGRIALLRDRAGRPACGSLRTPPAATTPPIADSRIVAALRQGCRAVAVIPVRRFGVAHSEPPIDGCRSACRRDVR